MIHIKGLDGEKYNVLRWGGHGGFWGSEGECGDSGFRDNLITSGSLGMRPCVGLLGFKGSTHIRLSCCRLCKPRPRPGWTQNSGVWWGWGLPWCHLFIYHLAQMLRSNSWWKCGTPFQRHGKCLWGDPHLNFSALLGPLGKCKDRTCCGLKEDRMLS